jgi:hypothetical protein
MCCFLKFATALLVGLAPAWCDQVKDPPKPPPAKSAVKVPPKNSTVNPNAKGKGNPKGVAKAPPVFRAIPNAQVIRFLRLTPEERQIAIDKMPIANQEPIRKKMAEFDALPAEERERQLKLWDGVTKLPKDKQDLVNQRLREVWQLPPDRRLGIRVAYQLLSAKTEEERRVMIDSQAFKDRFTPAEQQIIVDLVKYCPNPQM